MNAPGTSVACPSASIASTTRSLVTGLALTLLFSSASAASEPEFEDVSLGLPTGNYAGLAMADLDADGYAELLAGRREKAKGLHLFSFKASRWIKLEISSSGEYGGVALADVTGDKRPDVIASALLRTPRRGRSPRHRSPSAGGKGGAVPEHGVRWRNRWKSLAVVDSGLRL